MTDNKLEQAARQALEALEICTDAPMWDGKKNRKAIAAIKNALKESEDVDKRKSEQSV